MRRLGTSQRPGLTPLMRAQARRPGRRRTPAASRYLRRRVIAGLLLVAVLGAGAYAIVAGSGASAVGLSERDALLHWIARFPSPGPPAAAAVAAAEAGAINHALDRMPYVRIAGHRRREVALTFDDGPSPYTLRILSILEQAHVTATFFEVGVLESYFHAATLRMLADGDVVGDHTESHPPMSQLSRRDQRAQVLEQAAAVGVFGAPFPRLFRPPYGLWNRTTLALLHQYRMLMVLWTVDTSDYRRPGTSAIVRAAVTGARPGAIILMHDGGGNRQETVAALPAIIKGLRERGYTLVSVPRLLLDDPPPANQGIASVLASGG